MNIQQAQEMAQYRLFRPLALQSPHYKQYTTDAEMVGAIANWTSDILLGGHRYDLKTIKESVFQIQTNVLNRTVYIIPIWDAGLLCEIVTQSENKTGQVQRLLACGCLPELVRKLIPSLCQGSERSCCWGGLQFICGVLVLKRYFFKGTPRYREGHPSDSGWYVEDRYHLDVFTNLEPSFPGESSNDSDVLPLPPIQPIFRVFHDSVALVEVPLWKPHIDLDVHNQAVQQFTPEYYPPADEIIVSWHELAEHLGVQDRAIYAYGNFLAAQYEKGIIHSLDLPFFWGDQVSGGSIDISLEARQYIESDMDSGTMIHLFYAPYERFYWRMADFQEVTIDTDTQTPLPPYEKVSHAVVDFLEREAKGSAEYLGNGLFRLWIEDGTKLAAGSGNWGSPEYLGVSINADPRGASHPDATGAGSVTGSGGTSLVVDLFRFTLRDQIAQELEEARSSGSSAECIELVNVSLGKTFHDLGTATDLVEVIGGIVACIGSAFGGPVVFGIVCGAMASIIGTSAAQFYENTLGGYDYASDICDGLPDEAPFHEQDPDLGLTDGVGEGGDTGDDTGMEEYPPDIGIPAANLFCMLHGISLGQYCHVEGVSTGAPVRPDELDMFCEFAREGGDVPAGYVWEFTSIHGPIEYWHQDDDTGETVLKPKYFVCCYYCDPGLRC